MAQQHKVFVVIVTYNGMKWIEQCLRSIRESSLSTTVLAIDNGSNDGTIQFIRENFKEVAIVKNNQNLGFGKANNIGIAKAVEDQADYVLLLNQDAYLFPDALEKLIESFETHSRYGVLSPIQLHANGDKMESLFFQFNADIFNKVLTQKMLSKQTDNTVKVDFVQAACWLVKKEVFTRIDGFDELFYHYGEDNNFCQRLKQLGFDIGIVIDAFVYHDTTEETHKKRSIKYELNRYRSNVLKYIYDVNETDFSKHYMFLFKKCYENMVNAVFTASPRSAFLEVKKLVLLIKLISITKKKLKNLK